MNNREVSEIIGLADQGQISRMMKRLSEQGLVENTQGHTKRQARAWRLTSDGEAVIDAHRGGRALKQGAAHDEQRRQLVAEEHPQGRAASGSPPRARTTAGATRSG